jgi:hypothetical protein
MWKAITRAVVGLIVCAGIAVSLGGALAESATRTQLRAQTCGILPGDGAYNYVRVWNVGCAKAKHVGNKAFKRFCHPVQECFKDDPNADPVKGQVHVHAWRCKLKCAWEFSRIRCEAPHKRFVQASGA